MLLFASSLYFLYTSVLAAPIANGNLTELNTEIAPIWVSDPAGRGTWGLLYSCIFTILLCVYTAIHLNVPALDDTSFTFWRRKIKWVGIAILAPEIVLFTAFEQWIKAWRLLKALKKLAADSTDESFKSWYNSAHQKPIFDMVYAFYVVMGGLVIDMESLHNTLTRVTLTPNGVIFLAKHGHFCYVSRDEIDDKSKANLLAKGLVCVQVLWVAGQAIERKATGYPITLLEVHTLVHVLCALTMYAMWIRKPLNIDNPTFIDLSKFSDRVAFMLETWDLGDENMVDLLRKFLPAGPRTRRLPADVARHFAPTGQTGFQYEPLLGKHFDKKPIMGMYVDPEPTVVQLRRSREDQYVSPPPSPTETSELSETSIELSVQHQSYQSSARLMTPGTACGGMIEGRLDCFTKVRLENPIELEGELHPAFADRSQRQLDIQGTVVEGGMESTECRVEHPISMLSGEGHVTQVVTMVRVNCEDSDGVPHYHPFGHITSKYSPTAESAKVTCKLVQGQALRSGIGPWPPSMFRGLRQPPSQYQSDVPEIFEVLLTDKDVKRLELTASFVQPLLKDSVMLAEMESIKGTRSGFWPLWDIYNEPFPGWTADLVSTRARNFEGEIVRDTRNEVFAAMALLPIAYASVHLSALSVIFPTQIEKLLWKISCYWLIGVAAAYALNYFVVWLSYTRLVSTLWFGPNHDSDDGPYNDIKVKTGWEGFRGAIHWSVHWIAVRPRRFLSSFYEGGIAVIWIGVLVIYFGARLYLIVESFISLRHVPIGVYQTPDLNIMGNIPHL